MPHAPTPPSRPATRTHTCHVITTLQTGGAEMMLLKLVTASTSVRHSVICLDAGGSIGDRIAAAGIPVHTLDMPRRGGPAAALALFRTIRRLEPDVLQGWMYHGNLAATLGRAAAPRAALLWNVRATVYDLGKEKPGTARVIRLGAPLSRALPRRIIYNSHVAARQHVQLGYDDARTLVIPNGFDCERFAPSAAARAAVRARIGVAPDTPLVGLLARYHPMKDHAGFIAAAARVAVRHPDAVFVAAGTAVTHDNAALQSLLEQAGLRGRLRLLGEVADTAELTAALDVACSASAWGEGFPNVVGEAMACAVPCVVTDVGDAAWVVDTTGLVVAPGDSVALAGAIGDLLALPAGERASRGAAARQRVLDHFSLPAVADTYASLYDRRGAP